MKLIIDVLKLSQSPLLYVTGQGQQIIRGEFWQNLQKSAGGPTADVIFITMYKQTPNSFPNQIQLKAYKGFFTQHFYPPNIIHQKKGKYFYFMKIDSILSLLCQQQMNKQEGLEREVVNRQSLIGW